jgi:hypothetical protein
MHHFLKPALATVAVALLLSAAPAMAQAVTYKADLTGGAEVPPTDSTATGTAAVTYDPATKMLTWTVTYEGLSGDATAGHFHGPADPTAVADPVVPFTDPPASPIEGQAILTDAQAAELDAGMWYVNIHTAMFPDGEIRGQVLKGP